MGLFSLVERARREKSPALMGVLNVTPDSFSDGGKYDSIEAAERRVDELLEEGADIIDIGAESTRPGAARIDAPEQLRRAIPALEYALKRGALVSIDTTNAEVARACLDRGAALLNDVECLENEALLEVAREFGVPIVGMHSRGAMTSDARSAMTGFGAYSDDGYGDIVRDVASEWGKKRTRAIERGVLPGNIWFDPGLGFHKNARQSLELLGRLAEFRSLETVLVVGPSRKSFIGSLDGSGPEDRLGGTVAACLRAKRARAEIVRVHDVRAVRQALLVEGELDSLASRDTVAPRTDMEGAPP